MTIGELLAVPGLQRLNLIAGKTGLHRPISTVTVIDTPDGATWLKGEEFVITTAFAIKDDSELLIELVRQLASHRAAGLGIKTERYIKNIPQEAVELAKELDFPLITIPAEYAFCDIINPVLSRIINRQSVLLMQSAEIHKKFLELAVNDNSVPDILRTLSALLGRDAVFVDIHFRKLYFSDPESVTAKRLAGQPLEPLIHDHLPDYAYSTVENRVKKFGYILLAPGDNGGMEPSVAQTALEYASVVLILRMQTRISNHHIEGKYRDVFLEDLLLNNVKTENEIHNRAHLYGWRFDHGGLAAVIDINNIKKYYLKSLDPDTNQRLERMAQSIFDVSTADILAEFPDAKHYKQSDLIVFIIAAPPQERASLSQRLERVVDGIRGKIAEKVPFTITMGVGEYMENIRDIHQSYAQARTAIDLGYQLEMFDCTLFYNRLGIYRLLATTMHSQEFTDFHTLYIRPLVEYDAKNRASLMDTLRAVIKCGWNLKAASEELFVHYNSVKYRFSKICDVLHLDLRDHEYRLNVELALRMHMISRGHWNY